MPQTSDADVIQLGIPPCSNGPVVSKTIFQWLDDTEIALTHRKADRVKLSDIYVNPDLKIIGTEDTNLNTTKDSKFILDKVEGCYLVFGEEQIGKTTLCKYYFKEYAHKGYLPLYIDFNGINSANLDKILNSSLKNSYDNVSLEEYTKSELKKVLLIDNIDKTALNEKFSSKLIQELGLRFSLIIATANETYKYVVKDNVEFETYSFYEILPFGHHRREQIILKWLSLGEEESIQDSDLYKNCDDFEDKINGVIRRNIVPPKPIYILSIMQMFEANQKMNLDLTSFGHCYQALIYQSFVNAKIQYSDFEKYMNVLTELSWEIFKFNSNGLNQKMVRDFFEEYQKNYLSNSEEEIINKLETHSILISNGGLIHFKYPYIYYFFVGKKFAESYSKEQLVKESFDKLIKNLHREDYANILIFITHHSREEWVLNQIKAVLNNLYIDNKVATLTTDELLFMGEFINSIPQIVMEERVIHEERGLRNKELDNVENSLPSNEIEQNNEEAILANINQIFRGMEITGQIIKNRHASIKIDELEKLAKTGFLAGLRFLNYFINISDIAKNEIIRIIKLNLREKPNLLASEVEKEAEDVYLMITYGVMVGIINKIASSVGSKEAYQIYEKIHENEQSPALGLINLAIELNYNKKLDIVKIIKLNEEFLDKKNVVCGRIIREMVINHTYMFPVNFKEKQQLSTALNISMQHQSLMDRDKRIKQ